MLQTIDLYSEETPSGLPDERWDPAARLPELEDEEMIKKFEAGLDLGLVF